VIDVLSLPKQTHLFLLREKTLRCAFPGIENSLSKDLAVALNDSEFLQLHGELDTGRRQRLSPLVISYTFGDTGRR
ncbi:unnamed protein product, partial [Brassica napus]